MIEKKYLAQKMECNLAAAWEQGQIFQFDENETKPVFSIDTPPPTVSGHLHLGHVFSYSHADFIARFFRMKGYSVYYPMGFDDNGLPTERLVEKRLGIFVRDLEREDFIQHCLNISAEVEKDYEELWRRLGLSIDWRLTYRTIDEFSRRISQESFIDLYRAGLIYRKESPITWCPQCQTAIAQADQNDLERISEFLTLKFRTPDGEILPIATTRPELLAACVAIFVHPDDQRYQHLIGKPVLVPHYRHEVSVIADHNADPTKGTGAVMCCTFGDQTDINWWQSYQLNYIDLIQKDGRLSARAREIAGMIPHQARIVIKQILSNEALLLDVQPIKQEVRVHERCDTPVEWLMTEQWFIKIMSYKEKFLDLGERINWHPPHMINRYRDWVENLNQDWCISRQRYFGVPIPVWVCKQCGEVLLPEKDQLPINPLSTQPAFKCSCGSQDYLPERDVLDTWATSSLTPMISSHWRSKNEPDAKLLPLSLRPQAHEIIRTWAFYTIVKTYFHQKTLPWKDVLISGWGIAGEGMGKISKSRGGGPMAPLEMINRYSADAVRYWAACSTPGKDSVISEEKIQAGQKLINKLWNVARFCERFIISDCLPEHKDDLLPTDLWILAELQNLIHKSTDTMENFDYAQSKNEIESFFWHSFTDNYMEFVKQRLYNHETRGHQAANKTLSFTFKTVLKLFAPFLPFITDSIYTSLYDLKKLTSIHLTSWPAPEDIWNLQEYRSFGEHLIDIATQVRRYKSEKGINLGGEIDQIFLLPANETVHTLLALCKDDIRSVTRARRIDFIDSITVKMASLSEDESSRVAIPINESLF